MKFKVGDRIRVAIRPTKSIPDLPIWDSAGVILKVLDGSCEVKTDIPWPMVIGIYIDPTRAIFGNSFLTRISGMDRVLESLE